MQSRCSSKTKPCRAGVRCVDNKNNQESFISENLTNVVVEKSVGGSNVSQFENFFKKSFKKYVDGKEIDFSYLSKLSDKYKPVFFKGISSDEFVNYLGSFYTVLSRSLGTENLSLIISDNNRVGSDFFEEITKTHIEIKLGSATDLNIGIKSMENILGNNIMCSLPTLDDRKSWRNLYVKDKVKAVDKINKEHNLKLESFVNSFNKVKGQTLLLPGQKVMNSFWLGDNNLVLSGEIKRFQLLKDGSWVEERKAEIVDGWFYDSAVINRQNDGFARLNFQIGNENSINKLYVVYNYKNNYPHKVNEIWKEKAPAKLGLGSGSFNGWWR